VADTFAILTTGKSSQPVLLDLCERDENDEGQEILNNVGTVEMDFIDHQLVLKILKDKEVIHEVLQPEIHVSRFVGDLRVFQWTRFEITKLFFISSYLKEQPIYVYKDDNYGIGNFCEQSPDIFFKKNQEYTLADTPKITPKITVILKPDFAFNITLPNNTTYTKEHVFVVLDSIMGTAPAKLSLLSTEDRDLALDGCVQYHLEVEDHEEKGSIILRFSERKTYWNYLEHIISIYKSGLLPDVVDFLNKLDFEQLPLPHDYSWQLYPKPLTSLLDSLQTLGWNLLDSLNTDNLKLIKTITHEECRKALIKGICIKLFDVNDFNSNEKKFTEQITTLIASEFWNEETLLLACKKCDVTELFTAFTTDLTKDTPYQNAVNYLTALTPLLMKMFATHMSFYYKINKHIPYLRNLVNKFENDKLQTLKEHISSLEKQLLIQADKLNEHSILLRYLDIYINYPLEPSLKDELLQKLKTVPKIIRLQWLNNPGFYSLPIDQSIATMINPNTDIEIDEGNRRAFQAFFEELELEDLLLNRDAKLTDEEKQYECSLSTVMRWALIMEQEVLFTHVLKKCRENILDKETIENLALLVDYSNNITDHKSLKDILLASACL
jgi:hypothetical protein